MNLLLLEPDEMEDDGTICLQDRRAHHLLDILGVSPGQELRVGILGQGRSRAEVVSIRATSVVIRLTTGIEDMREARAIRLILALPRPKAIRRVVQNAACMGIARLDLVNAWKVSASYFSSPIVAPARLRHEAIIGAEQGARIRIPEIRVHRLFMPFLESLGTGSDELRLLAHPTAPLSLADVFSKTPDVDVTLAIGPEGGWVDREIASLQKCAFRPFRLGDWILRSEVALTAALAQIELLRQMTPPKLSDL